MSNDALDPYLRKRTILADLDIDGSTLHNWIKSGRFPAPTVINPGERREIVAWPQSVYLAWKASLPQRQAKPVTENAYRRFREKREARRIIRRPQA